ncbi:glycine dehydrogenase subunit 2 [Gammaproteobacteria bacterium]|nr:aminomethyl-transferring glycine dehydrogenase subunit GcvPB [Gammaproteobacteria bacterium]CAG0940923.1 glycine dehydrogenase subunit 2 [Gammaproteobacteria bacterium]
MSAEPVIFEHSRPGRRAPSHAPPDMADVGDLPAAALRSTPPLLPEVSELQVVRHFTRLSQLNFSIDTHFYPLGSCTMKYNPRASNRLAMLPGFLGRHPLAPEEHGQGVLACLYELQEMLKSVTGMSGVSLTPMAGAQGEYAGVAMIRAYHQARGDDARRVIIVPDAAHGTNPATATMCGYEVREIPTDAQGDVDLEALRSAVGPDTAGIMLTNPSTLGVFERRIEELAAIVHGAGGLLYYDGANLNAILGRALPAAMGFDVVHINLHKTFSTPHGGGGPGAGIVAVNAKLEPYLPVPIVGRQDGRFIWLTERERPASIGRLSAFMGNAGILLRAYVYMRMLGAEGMRRVSGHATLNANYLMVRLRAAGFDVAYPERRASHEFIISLKAIARDTGVTAMDFAKALLDRGFHAPTTYFPLLVPECLLIEPTETECREELDGFVAAMLEIRDLARRDAAEVKAAPRRTPVRRLDDVRAARDLDLTWQSKPRPPAGA